MHQKSLSRPSSGSGQIILPQIHTNYSAQEAAKGIEKRNRMKEYAQSIKKPIKVNIKTSVDLPVIPQKQIPRLQDLDQMEQEHASSMLEVLNIRRQLNL